MKKLKILVDVDSIAADTLPYWLDRIGKDTGVYAQVSDITLWAMDKCPPLDKVDPRTIFGLLQEPGFIRNVPPMAGAAGVLKQLMDDGHTVMFCTARHGPISMPDTLAWMREHFPFMSSEKQIAFIYDKEWLEADIIIDDKPTTLETYLAKHKNALGLTIEYPYNAYLKDAYLKGAERIRVVPRHDTSWADLYRVIRAEAGGSEDRSVFGS